MNISDVNAASTHRSDQLRNGRLGTAEPIDPAAAGASARKADDSGDRIEISDSARLAGEDVQKSEELTFARKALENVPSISEERIAELTDRIKSGYYQQPDVIDQIARRAGDELAAGL